MIVYLARHGESEWNADHRITGQRNPALTPAGRRQSFALAAVLRDIPLRAVHSSTLRRARETAAPAAISHYLTVHRHRALAEQHMGILEGRWRDARDPKSQRLWLERKRVGREFTPPGGESYKALRSRVIPCLERILKGAGDGATLIVGHRNVNRVILEHLLGADGASVALTPRSRWLQEITLGPTPSVAAIRLEGDSVGRRREVATK